MKRRYPSARVNVVIVTHVTDESRGPIKGQDAESAAAHPFVVNIDVIEQALNLLSRRIRERRSRTAIDCALAKERERSL